MAIERTSVEIVEFLMEIDDNGPSRLPGMTYEQGLTAALSWVLGEAAKEEIVG